jgi:hypothetical protein
MGNAKKTLESILQSSNIEEALAQHMEEINDFFAHAVESELQLARKKGDLDRIAKLEQVLVFLEKLSTGSEDVQILRALLEAESDEVLDQILEDNKEKVTSEEFTALLNNVLTQTESDPSQKEVNEKLRTLYRKVLRYAMRSNLKTKEQ